MWKTIESNKIWFLYWRKRELLSVNLAFSVLYAKYKRIHVSFASNSSSISKGLYSSEGKAWENHFENVGLALFLIDEHSAN